MVKIIMHGCNGHMGQVITGLVKEDANAEIIAGIDMNDNGQNDYPVFKSLAECDVPADVVVDFSSYKAADALLDACKEKKLPLVLCTTGLTEDQLKKVQETSKEIPVLRSANMSLGVNTLMKLVQAAAKVLAEAGFDMEIVEKHHKLKCDAPSGTAIALADSLIDEVFVCEEADFEKGVALLATLEKTVAEGAGAGGLAAILANPERFKGMKIGVELTGGNIDARMLAVVLNREMVREKRLIVYRILGDDRPGMLSAMAAVIGGLGGNIIDVVHNRLALDVPAKGAEFDIMVETRDARHAEEIGAALKERGYELRMG